MCKENCTNKSLEAAMDSKEKEPTFVQVWLEHQRSKDKKANKKLVSYLGNEDDNRDDDGVDCYFE